MLRRLLSFLESQQIHIRTEHTQHLPTGLLSGIIANLAFALMSVMVKLIGQNASITQILFTRFMTSLIFILPLCFKYPRETLIPTQPSKILIRSLFTILTLICFLYAIQFLPLTNALLFNNTTPLFIPFFLLIFYRIKTPYKVWIGILFGFIGIVLVLHPKSHFLEISSVIGLFSGIFGAAAAITIRFMTKTTNILQILFYNFFLGAFLSVIILPFNWHSINIKTTLLLLCIGIFGSIYYFFNIIAFAKAPVRITSSLTFLTIIFGMIADLCIWHIFPDWLSLVGIVCVICGSAMTIYFGQRM